MTAAVIVTEGRVWTRREWRDYLLGFEQGYSYGIDRGREQAESEGAALHHAAYEAVQAAARTPVRDHAADERQAARSESYWAERRAGEAS